MAKSEKAVAKTPFTTKKSVSETGRSEFEQAEEYDAAH
jgi:hypothetical protein